MGKLPDLLLFDDFWHDNLDSFFGTCEPSDDPKKSLLKYYDIVGRIRGRSNSYMDSIVNKGYMHRSMQRPGSYPLSETKIMDLFDVQEPIKPEPTKLGFSVTTSYKGGIDIEIGSDTIHVRKYTSVHDPFVYMLLFAEKVSCNKFEVGNFMVLPKTIIGMFKKSSSFTSPRMYEAGWAGNYGSSEETSSPVLEIYSDDGNFARRHTIDCSDTMGSMIPKHDRTVEAPGESPHEQIILNSGNSGGSNANTSNLWSAHQGVKPLSRDTEPENHGAPDSEHDTAAEEEDKIAATWLVASGAPCHLTGNRGLLSDFRSEHAGDGEPLRVCGRGGKVITDVVVLPDVFLFTGVTNKLVSASQRTELGYHSGPVVVSAGAGRGIALVSDVLMIGRSITGGPDAANRVRVFIIDSGAAVHATGDIAVFYEVNMEQTGRAIRVANGHSLEIRGRGSVSFGTFILRDVMFVPGLIKSVISVSQLMKQDYTPDFRPDGCFIRDAQNQVVGHARPVNGLFLLDHALPVPA